MAIATPTSDFNWASGDVYDAVFISDVARSRRQIWVNGKNIADVGGPAGAISQSSDITIGGWTGDSWSSDGEINFFRMYSHAWTPEMVRYAYQRPYDYWAPITRHIPVGIVTTPEPGVTVTLQRPGGGSPDFTEEELRQFNIGMWAVIEGASWVAQLPDPLPEQVMLDIIDGLQDWSSPENDAQFEKTRQLMRDDPTHGSLRVISDTLIFTLPITPDYDIQTNGSLQFVVPSSAYEPTP